jgi:hypothetical protein
LGQDKEEMGQKQAKEIKRTKKWRNEMEAFLGLQRLISALGVGNFEEFQNFGTKVQGMNLI